MIKWKFPHLSVHEREGNALVVLTQNMKANRGPWDTLVN